MTSTATICRQCGTDQDLFKLFGRSTGICLKCIDANQDRIDRREGFEDAGQREDGSARYDGAKDNECYTQLRREK